MRQKKEFEVYDEYEEELNYQQIILRQIEICQNAFVMGVGINRSVATLFALIPTSLYDDEFIDDVRRAVKNENILMLFRSCINLLDRRGLLLHPIKEEIFK